MLYSKILSCCLIVGAMAIGTGCDKASDDQAKANAAQTEANDKIAAAKTEADKKAVAAQTEADQKIAEARASFTQRREDYRHKTTTNLAELDRKVDGLNDKSKSATGQAQSDLNANLTQIHSQREAFMTDYNTLETVNADTWDAAQTRLDKKWADLKALVDRA
jgi:hypothetical protein